MNIRKFLSLLLFGALLLTLAGCGAAPMEASDGFYARYETEEAPSSNGLVADASKPVQSSLPENRKMVQKVWLGVETEALDTLLSQVNEKIGQLGGYVEAQNIYNGSAYSGRRYRNAEIRVRIPAASLNEFVEQVGGISNIVSNRQTMDDITLSYIATESRITALETEQTRLLELLAMAETMDDLLTIEARLTDVRAELEQVKSTLKLYDNQVDYGTVYLSISEVTEYTVVTEPETVWERIGEGFRESLQDIGEFFVELFVFVIVALPYLVMIGAVVGVVVFLSIRRRKKKAAKQAEAKKDP